MMNLTPNWKRDGAEIWGGADDECIPLFSARRGWATEDDLNVAVAAPELLRACLAVWHFLNKLEENTAPDDPLKAIRERIHAPMRRLLHIALTKAGAL